MIKSKFLRLKMLILMIGIFVTVYAHDFEVDGIYYNKTSSNEVAVTFKGSSYSQYNDDYVGTIVIPENVTYQGTTYSVTAIATDGFRGCTNLNSVYISDSVTTIGNRAFFVCRNLTSIRLSNSLISIGKQAFQECYDLGEINIPSSVQMIGEAPFIDCGLNSINVDAGNQFYASIDGVLYNKALDSLIAFPKGKSGSFEVPDSVVSIIGFAFWRSKLTSLEIPNSVTYIGNNAFTGSRLMSITIPYSVTHIGTYAFSTFNAVSVKCYIPNPFPTEKPIVDTFHNYTLYVPKGTKKLYESTAGWKDFKTIIDNLENLGIPTSVLFSLNL